MSYKDNYKSLQVNIPKDKCQELIDWMYEYCEREQRSINSLIVKLLKEEKERDDRRNKE